jgi:hypothetical protein
MAAVMAAPAAADTNTFAGILDDGRLVRFTSQAPTALTTPVPVRGMRQREQVLALAGRQGRLYGLGSAARLYAIDPVTARATPVAGGVELAQGLRGRRFSLVISADGARARILSDVGQDVTVDLATGASTTGPGLRAEDGSAIDPTVTTGADGRLVGVDLGRRAGVQETAPGSGVAKAAALQGFARAFTFPPADPTAFAVGAADGVGYLLSAFSDRGRDRQSQLTRVNAGTGQATFASTFMRRLVTFGATGAVAEDERAPRARITVPRRMSLRSVLGRRRVPVTVRMDEGGQVLTSFRMGARDRAGFGLVTTDVPTTYRGLDVPLNLRDRRVLRRYVGRRVRIAVTTNDFAGNGRTVIRQTRLTR